MTCSERERIPVRQVSLNDRRVLIGDLDGPNVCDDPAQALMCSLRSSKGRICTSNRKRPKGAWAGKHFGKEGAITKRFHSILE